MQIGSIKLPEHPLFLAPLEDVTNKVFRKICRESGADFTYTEFISGDAITRGVKSIREKMKIQADEHPIGIQLYGKDVDTLVEAAKIAEEAQPDLIDLNFGCPARKIANKGGGSGLLNDLPLLLEITSKVVKAVQLPVTVKTRLGWDEHSMVFPELALRLQDCGIAALCIHGRTKKQMYGGVADWTLIGEVKKHPDFEIPLIGNGDLFDGPGVKHAFEKYGVDAVMIGRAAIGNPFVFKKIKQYLEGGEDPVETPVKDHVDMIRYMLENYVGEFGEPSAILQMRRHMAKHFTALPGIREYRIKMLRATDKETLTEVFDLIEERYKEFSIKTGL